MKDKQGHLKPIESNEMWERVQIDLIDMRSEQYDGYQWIAHVMDHFSKFHILWPMKKKTGMEVVNGLRLHVLPYFGLPTILQSDNGLEFCNELVTNLVDDWRGKLNI